jgi:KaiC/GvpD/RAD55 family RecA-like ATPase
VPESYAYSEDFQQRIVALCLKDPVFIRDYEDVVDPKFFDYDYLSSIVRVALEHVTKHNEIPAKATLLEDLKDFCSTYKISPVDAQEMFDKVRDVYAVDLIDPESVKERVVRFGKRQALKSSVMQIVDIIDNDAEYDRANELVQDALKVGHNTHDLGIQGYGQFQELPSMIAQSGAHDKKRKVPTLFSTFDTNTMGGPGRKELWVVLGLPGVGKSQWLVNIGAAALNQGFSVAHLTIGDLDQVDVFGRYGARLTHLPIRDVIDNTDVYKRRAKKLDQYLERYLRIKYYSSGTLTCAMIRAYLSRLITVDGITPDLLLLDYPDKMKRLNDNDYTNMGMIYTGISGIVGDFDLLSWAASQVQRWSPKGEEEYITQDNVADSWRKAHEVDGLITFNQTVAEYKRGRARGWVDKVRRGIKHFMVHLQCDFAMSYIREMTESEIIEEKKLLEEDSQKERDRRKKEKTRAKNKNVAEGKKLAEGLEETRKREEGDNVIPFPDKDNKTDE